MASYKKEIIIKIFHMLKKLDAGALAVVYSAASKELNDLGKGNM